MSKIEIVSWYTANTVYEQVFREYLFPCLHIGTCDYNSYACESKGDWVANTNLKPEIIQRALKDTSKDILVLDADAKIYSHPQLLEDLPDEYDIAVYWLDWKTWYRHNQDIKELCTGTLFFRNRAICGDLIEEWRKASINSKIPDQKVLQQVLQNTCIDIKIYNLPYEYCWINSLPDGKGPYIERPKNVVIEHFQASRELRRKI